MLRKCKFYLKFSLPEKLNLINQRFGGFEDSGNLMCIITIYNDSKRYKSTLPGD